MFLLCSCSGAIRTSILKEYPEKPLSTPVTIVSATDSLPESSEHIANVEVKDSGFSVRCNYNYGIHSMSMEALKAGGNLVQITEHTPPKVLGSSCHRFKAKIYLVSEEELDSVQVESVPESSPYYEK